MKIVYVSNSLIPSQSANSVHVMKMANAFIELGHDVTLIGRKNKDYIGENLHEFYGVDNSIKLELIEPLKIKYFKHISFGNHVKNMIKELNPDLLIGRSLQGFYFLKDLGIDFIFESHEPVFNFQYKLNGLYFKRLMLRKILRSQNIRGFVLISDELKKLYNFNDFPALNVIVAHDGADKVNLHEFAKLQGNNDNIKIGYIGKFHEGRGLKIVVDVAKSLSQIEFHLLGGSDEELMNLLDLNQIPDNIFCYNFIEPSDVHKYRNAMNVLIAPYQNEVNINSGINTTNYMSPIKIFEYMASKKPIISSDFKVLREVLNENNSILVPPDDVDAWGKAIKKLEIKDVREKLANQAFEDFKEKYTWKKRVERILEDTGY